MKPINCLLIDDDAEEAEIFHYALEELNRPVKCFTARNGKDAIACLTRNAWSVDFIFLDMNMPRMNGEETLRQIRKLDEARHIPIVLYSSSFPDEQKTALSASGASNFLVKSGSVFDLQNALFRLFAEFEISRLTLV